MDDSRENQPAVTLKNLHKSFGDQAVLDGIDLQVRRGETLAVLGRSGTGKSVLLKLIIGLQAPDSGSIQIHGQDIIGLPLEQLNEIRTKVGFLFQEAALYDSLSATRRARVHLRVARSIEDVRAPRLDEYLGALVRARPRPGGRPRRDPLRSPVRPGRGASARG